MHTKCTTSSARYHWAGRCCHHSICHAHPWLEPELARMLPPGIADTGTVSFWVRGQTLFGDTTDTISGPNTSLRSRRTWKATRVSSYHKPAECTSDTVGGFIINHASRPLGDKWRNARRGWAGPAFQSAFRPDLQNH